MNILKKLMNPILFNYTFLLDLALSKVVYLNGFTNFICKFFTVWAFFIILYHIYMKKIKYNYPLVLFILFMMITILINFKANLYLNLVMCAFVCCYIFISFTNYDIETKTIIKYNNIYIFIFTILALLSVLTYFFNFEFAVNEVYYGYHWDVLYGVFDNPNSGSINCVISIFMICMNFILKKKEGNYLTKFNKIFYVISILVTSTYLFIADSRGGQLTLISFFFVIFILYFIKLSKKYKYLGICCSVIIFLISSIIVIKSPMTQLKKIFITNEVEQVVNIEENQESIGNGNVETPISPAETIVENESNSDEFRKESNISSSRFVLWKAGIKVICEHPMFGVGQANVLDYVKEASEDDSIDSITAGGVHNGYIDLAISNGIFGLILFMLGILLIIIKTIDKLIHTKERINSLYIIILIGIIFSILVNNLVETSMVMAIFATAQYFWMTIGMLNNIEES